MCAARAQKLNGANRQTDLTQRTGRNAERAKTGQRDSNHGGTRIHTDYRRKRSEPRQKMEAKRFLTESKAKTYTER